MNWLIAHYKLPARVVAWVGIVAITILTVVPAADRPVTAAGSNVEHFTIFFVVFAAFALGYQLSLFRFVLFALLFCGGIELLQVPLPTRHARVSDFIIDFFASCFAIAVVFAFRTIIGRSSRNKLKNQKWSHSRDREA